MRCYHNFTTEQREKILVLKDTHTQRQIASIIGCSASSVSREFKRNGGKPEYSPSGATLKYQSNRKRSHKKHLLSDRLVLAHVAEKLKLLWSPEQICGRINLENRPFSISYGTIYRGFRAGLLPRSLSKCLRRRGRKHKPKSHERRGKLSNYRKISERPVSCENRSRFGHFEGDTLHGALNKGCIATFVDRKSRFLLAGRMLDKRATSLTDAVNHMFADIPANRRRSFTVDHGKEFFGHRYIEEALAVEVYFADPFSPWQRGTNENTNGLLRQYFPKKTDFLAISDLDVESAVDSLNDRPRKVLGFRTPAEVFFG